MGWLRSCHVIGRMVTMILAICAPVLLATTDSKAADCRADQLVEMPAGAWLVVSEVALTAAPCPPAQNTLGESFPFHAGDTVYIFLRIQGNLALLEHVGSHDRLRIILRRSNDLQESTYPLELSKDRIGLVAAAAEAGLPENAGQFDWRFFARVRALFRPGEYSLTLSYGGRPLCQLDGSCSLHFEVQ